MDCPHCQHSRANSRGGSCPECGRTLIRNLADSTSLRKALANVGVVNDTPYPTAQFPGIDLEHNHFDLPERVPGSQETDSHYGSHAADTDAAMPRPLIAGSSTQHAALPVVPGYDLEQVIGRGGMGTVFLARQKSLDRPVALKIMSRRWADDPTFVARFTREAYAAARLNHPNLVQVYDIGEVDGQRFFSMEYVDGKSLADVVRAAGKLDPETAVGYILQAARGLKHAHDRGMIHRDIKPDNRLLDGQGLVKVADLGLVKTPDLSAAADASTVSDEPVGLKGLPTDMTGCRMALGTPAYMSPEQCRDAATVDHRADIYSLGCTMYALVTGRQPFDGDTAVELMTKHAYTPLVPPEEVAARVPRELSAVIQKMMAKHPGERYQKIGDVIRVLEQWLGIQSGSPQRIAAGDDQIDALEACVREFQLAPSAILRTRLLTAFFGGCLLAAVVLVFTGKLGWAFGLAGLIVQASLVYFAINGTARRTHLFRRVRHTLQGFSVGDWLVAFAMIALFGILLWMLKLFWMWVGFGLIGAALACALRFGLDRAVDAERQRSLSGCERLLRRLRVQGLDEDQLRLFVAKYAGRQWEEFFEALFGYEAKMEARHRLLRGESFGHRERHAAWREPILALLDYIDRARRALEDKRLLLSVEEERLKATGLSPRAAQTEARRNVEAMLHHAAAYHSAEEFRRQRSEAGLKNPSGDRPGLQKLLSDPVPAQSDLCRRLAGVAVGPAVRGTLAIACLILFALWTWQNNVVLGTRNAENMTANGLSIPGIPCVLTNWIDSANIGIAGVLLLTSLLYHGNRMGLLVLVGSGVAVAAHHFGIRAVEPIRDFHVGLMLGTVIALVGFRFGER